MSSSQLQAVANVILSRAEEQGFVIPKEIRAELKKAGEKEARWKEIAEMLRESLNYRQGRYYYLAAANRRQAEEMSRQEQLRKIVDELLQTNSATDQETDRRDQQRREFNKSLLVRAEDGSEFTVMGRDLSPSGIRIISNRSLLGRKLRVELAAAKDDKNAVILLTRILWTTAVADGVYENGGSFLDLAD